MKTMKTLIPDNETLISNTENTENTESGQWKHWFSNNEILVQKQWNNKMQKIKKQIKTMKTMKCALVSGSDAFSARSQCFLV